MIVKFDCIQNTNKIIPINSAGGRNITRITNIAIIILLAIRIKALECKSLSSFISAGVFTSQSSGVTK